MRTTLKIGGREISIKILAALIGCSLIAGVAALQSIGVIDIGYIINPSAGESPVMDVSPLNLNLGIISSGSSGIKDFGKQATLDLPVSYEITFTLDLATAEHFTTFNVDIYLWKPEEIYWSYSFHILKSEIFHYDSQVLLPGTYEVQVEVEYTAVSVTAETSGTVQIDISYPG